MSDPLLLDIIGGLKHVDLHPFKQLLAYDAGTFSGWFL